MRLLLDTHSFLWFIEDSPKVSAAALALMKDGSNDVFLSITSLWEMAIKIGLGKLELRQDMPFEVFIYNQLSLNRFNLLPITIDHLGAMVTLPLYHRDPFERLL